VRASLGAVALAGALGCTTTQPIELGDRHLVVTVESLAAWADVGSHQRAQGESFEKRRWFDGTVEIEYTFDPGDAPSEVPYLYSLFHLHRTSGDACSSFGAGNAGASLAADIEEHDELFRYGDRSTYGFFVAEGEPIGTFFNMCRSRTSLLVMIAGYVFDGAGDFQYLVAPHLRAIEEYESREADAQEAAAE
jgi:hypothetical protein